MDKGIVAAADMVVVGGMVKDEDNLRWDTNTMVLGRLDRGIQEAVVVVDLLEGAEKFPINNCSNLAETS